MTSQGTSGVLRSLYNNGSKNKVSPIEQGGTSGSSLHQPSQRDTSLILCIHFKQDIFGSAKSDILYVPSALTIKNAALCS
jgi:hypothetical protein